jgi:hypothetical protein
MLATTTSRVILGVMVIAAALGATDAGQDGRWDTVTLFVVVTAGALGLLLRTWVGRPLVGIRSDLARWLAREAATADEPTGQVADRAIAAWRAGMTTADGSDTA